MARLRTTLPEDIEERLTSAPLEELKAIFETTELTATGGYAKHTVLGFLDCPDDLMEWIVGRGLDVDTPDADGDTPLHRRASSWKVDQIPLLLRLGADLEARGSGGRTPLMTAARQRKAGAVEVLLEAGADVGPTDRDGRTALDLVLVNTGIIDLSETARIVAALLRAGLPVTDAVRQEVTRIGQDLEFRRPTMKDKEFLDTVDRALRELYQLTGTGPVARRVVHDGRTPISVPAGPWTTRFDALWDLLVPAGGAASTVQGEVIRIAGRVGDEIDRNGGANWDQDYRAMLVAYSAHVGTGVPLPPHQLAETERLCQELAPGPSHHPGLDRLAELAVIWVGANPIPVALADPPYAR